MTLDNPENVENLPLRIENAEDIAVTVGESFSPQGEVVTATKGFTADCSLIFLGGQEDFNFENNAYTPTKAGEYKAVLTYCYEGDYSVISNVINVKVAEKQTEPQSSETDGDSQVAKPSTGGCGGNMGGTAACLTLFAAVATIKEKLKGRV